MVQKYFMLFFASNSTTFFAWHVHVLSRGRLLQKFFPFLLNKLGQNANHIKLIESLVKAERGLTNMHCTVKNEIRQVYGQKLELRLTPIQRYNEKVEVLASLGPKKNLRDVFISKIFMNGKTSVGQYKVCSTYNNYLHKNMISRKSKIMSRRRSKAIIHKISSASNRIIVNTQ